MAEMRQGSHFSRSSIEEARAGLFGASLVFKDSLTGGKRKREGINMTLVFNNNRGSVEELERRNDLTLLE